MEISGKEVIHNEIQKNAVQPVSWDKLPEDHTYSKKDIKRNMACCILMDAFFAFGWADMQVALQPLLVFLNASNTMIGFIMGMNWLAYFGLFVSPWISRRYEYKKKYFFVTNIPYLFPILLGGVATLIAAKYGWPKELLLMVIVWAFAFHWFFGGFVSLPHTEYIAACIPATYRATMTGMSVSVGSALGLLSTTAGYFILDKIDKPAAYGYLFIMTWFIVQVGYVAALMAKERRTPVEKAPKAWSKSMFKAFWDDKRYVRFVILWSTYNIFLGTAALSFINLYGLKSLNMLPKTAAIMGGIQLVMRILTAGPLGAFIDRVGAKRIFPWLGIIGGSVLFPVLIFKSPMSVYVSIGLSVVFYSAFAGASSILQYGLPKPENRSGHFTILIMAQVIAMSAGAMFIGWMLDVIGYINVFVMISIFGFVLTPITWFLVKDYPENASEFH